MTPSHVCAPDDSSKNNSNSQMRLLCESKNYIIFIVAEAQFDVREMSCPGKAGTLFEKYF
jgi:hypothetical protein